MKELFKEKECSGFVFLQADSRILEENLQNEATNPIHFIKHPKMRLLQQPYFKKNNAEVFISISLQNWSMDPDFLSI